MIGGQGSDIFVLAEGAGTDTIADLDNPDVIGLAGGLTFDDLSFSGSSIILTSTSEVLAILDGVNAESLSENDFTTV